LRVLRISFERGWRMEDFIVVVVVVVVEKKFWRRMGP